MRIYRKEIQPCSYSGAWMGISDPYDPLEDWQPEENLDMLKEKYRTLPDHMAVLKFKERYVEAGEITWSKFPDKTSIW